MSKPDRDQVDGPPIGEGWSRSDVLALRTRPCPDCNGHQRLLAWFDEGAERPWLECEDCQHSWSFPDLDNDHAPYRPVGAVRDVTDADLHAAGWEPDDFYRAECWWTD